jgi:hypothetical protein
MSKPTPPPAPPAVAEDEGQPWDLSRLVASAAPPPAPREETAPDWPSPRQSYPLGEITPATPRRRARRAPRGVQALVAFSIGALVALVGSVRGADAPTAAAPLDPERGPESAPTAPAAAPATSAPATLSVASVVESPLRVDAPAEPVERVAAQRTRVARSREAVEDETTIAEAEPTETIEAEVAAPPARPTIDTASASMNELLDHAVAHVEPLELPTHEDREAPQPEPSAEEAEAPIGPDRDEVQRVMEELRPALQQCAAGGHGTTQVQLKVTPSGRARAIRINGPFAGSPEGSCMARAARTARFAGHEGDEDVTVRYPYRF